MSEYIIKPVRRNYEKEDGSFSIYLVREHPRRGEMGGLATATFSGRGPSNLSKSYKVRGNFERHPEHGLQLEVESFQPFEHKDTRISITAVISDLKRSNDQGTWFLYSGQIEGADADLVSFGVIEPGTHKLFGEWQESKYGQSFKVSKIVSAEDWLDATCKQAMGERIMPEFEDSLEDLV